MDLAAERKELVSTNASNDKNNNGNTDNPQEIPDSTSSFASDGNNNPDKGAEERQARDLKAGLHPLKHKFVFWYTRRTPGVRSQGSYEDNIKKLADFSTLLFICGSKDSGSAIAILLALLLCQFQQICTFLRKESALCGRILRTAMVESGLYDSKRLCLVVFERTWFLLWWVTKWIVETTYAVQF